MYKESMQMEVFHGFHKTAERKVKLQWKPWIKINGSQKPVLCLSTKFRILNFLLL